MTPCDLMTKDRLPNIGRQLLQAESGQTVRQHNAEPKSAQHVVRSPWSTFGSVESGSATASALNEGESSYEFRQSYYLIQ